MESGIDTELEAAAFRRLLSHLQQHTEVQNIDLMILADFCRNCLSKWLVAAANERGTTLEYNDAREHVYGMPYDQWRAQNQTEAGPEKQAAFEKAYKENVGDPKG